ncbi:MAG: GNAT family N-acetyltransferase [Jiangellaceae bacterium]
MHRTPIVRTRHPDEIGECVAMLGLVHAIDGYPARWPDNPRPWLTPAGTVGAWVAADPEGLAGHVVMHRPTGDAEAAWVCAAAGSEPARMGLVSRLFVVPRARRAGVGAALLETVAGEASARGLRPGLAVTDGDRSAMALYERCGWERVDSTPWTWAGGGATVLHCYLGPTANS